LLFLCCRFVVDLSCCRFVVDLLFICC
jgi:hypothetical protein